MNALAVTPRVPSSARLVNAPEPKPGPGEVLIQVRRVGICGTDREIGSGLYGDAPAGEQYLILGHEGFGSVASVGEHVSGFHAGDLVVATVRRPDTCPNCQRGESDMCLWGDYTERGIRGQHGYLAEYYTDAPDFLVCVPPELEPVAVLLEPLSVGEKAVSQSYAIQQRMFWEPRVAVVTGAGPIGILASLLLRLRGLEVYTIDRTARQLKAEILQEAGCTYLAMDDPALLRLPQRTGRPDLIVEATGSSTVAFHAAEILGTNGVLCLTSVTGGDAQLTIPADRINLELVLGNKTIFGSVNANRRYFEEGIEHMTEMERRWPGLLGKLITRRVPLDAWATAMERVGDDIKTVVEMQA